MPHVWHAVQHKAADCNRHLAWLVTGHTLTLDRVRKRGHLLPCRLIVPVDIDAAHVLAAGRGDQSVTETTPEPARMTWRCCKRPCLQETLPVTAVCRCSHAFHVIARCPPDEANHELAGGAVPCHKAWEVASAVHEDVHPATVVGHNAAWPCPRRGSMLRMLGLGRQLSPLHPPEAQAEQAAAHAATAGCRHEGWAPSSGHQKGGSA